MRLAFFLGYVVVSFAAASEEESCGERREVQLAGCNTDCGRVEVKINGSWHGLHIRPWTLREATVACRAAGFAVAASASEEWPTASERLVRAVLVGDSFEDLEFLGEVVTDARGVGVGCRTGQMHVDDWALEKVESWEMPLASPFFASANPFLESELRRAFVFPNDLLDDWNFLNAEYQKRVNVDKGLAVQLTAVGAIDGTYLGLSKTKDAHALWLRKSDPPFAEKDAYDSTIARDLIRDGVAAVRDFGFPPAILDELEAASRAPFEVSNHPNVSVSSGGTVATARVPLLMLEDWLLKNATLIRALKSYLGDSVVFDGYKATYLRGLETTDDYIASLWHHDRVGRRIKMFIFLHDVDCDKGHPTKIAKGTHKMTYFKTDSFPASRFNDDYVTDTFDVHVACGPRGGGFLFDTHTIHKGTPEGSQDRLTVIAEFHNANKCPTAHALGLQLPCPSGDQWPLLRHNDQRFLLPLEENAAPDDEEKTLYS